MSKRILLITGWGVGTVPLQPLQYVLQQQGHEVVCIDIFDPQQPEQAQQALQHALQADVLVGWSLGGQLALCLAKTLWQTKGQTKPVIALASNPCFVENEHWASAMPQAAFDTFEQQFLTDAAATLKQFYLNICRGQLQVKQNWLALCKNANPPERSQLVTGLQHLRQLNLLEMLQHYPAPINFIFAEHDALIPSKIVQEIAKIASNNVTVQVFEQAGHSFPAFCVEETLQAITTLLDG